MDISRLRGQVFEPLHSRISGSPKLKFWKELEESQYFSEERLRRKQWSRLQELLNYVYDNTPFYKRRFDRAGIKPETILKADDITRIPILTKDEIRQHSDEMISEGYRKENLMQFKTGGSTGKALELFITEECSEMRNACARRHDRWSGWEVGEPIGAVWGNPDYPKGVKGKLKNWLISPTIYLDTMSVSEKSVKEFVKEWERIGATLLFGHAHSLFILAKYVKKFPIETIKPKGIISSCMMLLPHERKTIEEVFGTRVFDRYGCEEVSLIASECEQGKGMHMNIEHLYIEFLKPDGNYARPGEKGSLIITDLMNWAMPFIRYRVEDIGVPSDKKCTCGRGLPLMENVTGRVADFLVRKDGGLVAGVSLIERTLTAISGIEQMQIVQDSINEISLKVVKDSEFNSESEKALLSEFKSVFGVNTQVRIKFLDDIKPEKSGKYRFSISHVISRYH